jgi:hypothetical protein
MQIFISLYYDSMTKLPVNAPAESNQRSRRVGAEVRESSQVEKS